MILNVKNTSTLITQLTVPTFALRSEADYVGTPPKVATQIVKGGHVSPLEVPDAVNDFCRKMIESRL